MNKKILGLVFVMLSLLFMSVCSNASSKPASNELDGEYFQTTNDYYQKGSKAYKEFLD